MTCDFTSFLKVFQSYQDDVWIMKGCVQWNSVYGWKSVIFFLFHIKIEGKCGWIIGWWWGGGGYFGPLSNYWTYECQGKTASYPNHTFPVQIKTPEAGKEYLGPILSPVTGTYPS